MKGTTTALERQIVEEGSVLDDERPNEIVFDSSDWVPGNFANAMKRLHRKGNLLDYDRVRFIFGFADGSTAEMKGFPDSQVGF